MQLLPPQYKLCAGLVVELRGDVEALGLGERVAGSELSVEVFVGPELKFQPGCFFPRWLQVIKGGRDLLG